MYSVSRLKKTLKEFMRKVQNAKVYKQEPKSWIKQNIAVKAGD